MRKVITVIGPPGSGKTTMAKLLANELNYKYVSTGDFVRMISQKVQDNELQSGGLSSTEDEIRNWVLGEIRDNKGKVVLDGFPRTPEQFKLIGDVLSIIVLIVIDYNTCTKRLLSRSRDDQDVERGKIEKRITTYDVYIGSKVNVDSGGTSFLPSIINDPSIDWCVVNGNKEPGDVYLDVVESVKRVIGMNHGKSQRIEQAG